MRRLQLAGIRLLALWSQTPRRIDIWTFESSYRYVTYVYICHRIAFSVAVAKRCLHNLFVLDIDYFLHLVTTVHYASLNILAVSCRSIYRSFGPKADGRARFVLASDKIGFVTGLTWEKILLYLIKRIAADSQRPSCQHGQWHDGIKMDQIS